MMRQSFLTKSQLQEQFQDSSKDLKDQFRSNHSFYGIKSGKVKDINKCANFNIDDPNCEVLLQDAIFYFKDAATCFKQKSVEIFFKQNFSSRELEQSIENYTTKYTESGDKYLHQYKSNAKQRTKLFAQRFGTNDTDSYGCCLALSYYTGVLSERVSRSSNIIIKLDITEHTSKLENMDKFGWMKCISYWMFKALHYIPLYWGKVIRCIDLKSDERSIYKVGSIVTWIQFSSSSYGQPTDTFKNRNTRFIIYSISGRNIQNFSNYGNETQVLFKPYTHFIVLKQKIKEEITYIYIREIFFGQSSKNILWVDDNIFDDKWENKILMERAILKEPLLNIIPKISTEAAMAFIKSQLCRNRKPNEFRIITDMTRLNQASPYNAGARFVKELLPIYNNLKILIFTSNKAKGEECLLQLNIPKNLNIQVADRSDIALSFLKFQ